MSSMSTSCLVRRTAFVAAIAFMGACDASPPSRSPPSGVASSGVVAPGPQAIPKVDVGPEEVDAIVVHTGGAQASDKVPVVVAIHGLGDRPDAFRGLFDGFPGKARFVFPAGGLPAGGGYSWWPILGRIDENNVVPGLVAASERLAGALRKWQSGAAGKPIVTGFSQGGMLSFTLAVRHPELIAEAVPVAGLVPPTFLPAAWPEGTPKPRIFALHGSADQRVPFTIAEAGAEKLKALGVPVEFRSYPGVAHSISPEMRRDLFEAIGAAVDRAAKAN